MFFENGHGQVGAGFSHPIGLNIVAFECFNNFPDRLRGNGGASAQDYPEGGIIKPLQIRMVDHHVEHRGDQV